MIYFMALKQKRTKLDTEFSFNKKMKSSMKANGKMVSYMENAIDLGQIISIILVCTKMECLTDLDKKCSKTK